MIKMSDAIGVLRKVHEINQRLIKKGQSRNRQTVNLIGSAGIGKTSIVYQAFPKAKIHKINPAQFVDPGDISGSPIIQVLCEDGWVPQTIIGERKPVYVNGITQTRTTYAKPVWWPVGTEPTILLIDDSWRGTAPIQQALMELYYEYTYNGEELPSNVMVVLTNNPSDDEYSVAATDPAQLRRTVNLKVEFNQKDFVDYISTRDFNPRLVEFIISVPEALQKTEGGVTKHECPASIERFSHFLGEEDPSQDNLFLIGGKGYFADESLFVENFNRFLKDSSFDLPKENEYFEKPVSEILKALKPVREKRPQMGIVIRRIATYAAKDFTNRADRVVEYLETDLFGMDQKQLLRKTLNQHGITNVIMSLNKKFGKHIVDWVDEKIMIDTEINKE